MSLTCGIQADFVRTVAVGPLSCLVDTSHPEPEHAPCRQVRDVVVAVTHARGDDQPVSISCREERGRSGRDGGLKDEVNCRWWKVWRGVTVDR